MDEDTVEISLESRVSLLVENAYREGWKDRHLETVKQNPLSNISRFDFGVNIDSYWKRSDTKRAMES